MVVRVVEAAPHGEEDEHDADVEGRGEVGQVRPGEKSTHRRAHIHAIYQSFMASCFRKFLVSIMINSLI